MIYNTLENRKGWYNMEEILRYKNMCTYETEAYKKGAKVIVGVDEAGRGPLAGPVVAAAVVLPEGIIIEKLNDSKKLTAKKRQEIYEVIVEKAVDYSIGIVDEKCIDEINILNATKKAMKIAISNLSIRPDIVLIDAVKLNDISVKQVSIIKGDALSISIAAASILAKVTRDKMMVEMDKIYPQYGFAKHKGYGTKAHIEAIKKYGITPIHRLTFTRKFTTSANTNEGKK
jgi:ribonuclease HII